jgi:phage-related protein
VRIAGKVHVLHAFQKKSKSGIKTPREDIKLIEQRLKVLLERSEGPND